MPELLSSAWAIVLSAGGYAIAIVQFAKESLETRKLRLEIIELKRKLSDGEKVIALPTPAEIEQYGRGLHTRTVRRSSLLGLVAVIGIGAMVYSSVQSKHETRLAQARLNESLARMESDRQLMKQEREMFRKFTLQLEERERRLAAAEERAAAGQPRKQ